MKGHDALSLEMIPSFLIRNTSDPGKDEVDIFLLRLHCFHFELDISVTSLDKKKS